MSHKNTMGRTREESTQSSVKPVPSPQGVLILVSRDLGQKKKVFREVEIKEHGITSLYLKDTIEEHDSEWPEVK